MNIQNRPQPETDAERAAFALGQAIGRAQTQPGSTFTGAFPAFATCGLDLKFRAYFIDGFLSVMPKGGVVTDRENIVRDWETGKIVRIEGVGPYADKWRL